MVIQILFAAAIGYCGGRSDKLHERARFHWREFLRGYRDGA